MIRVISPAARHRAAFIVGSLLVSAGVVLHIPMYWMGRHDGFRLAGMDMDAGMLWGMAAIAAGIALAGWGLLPDRMRAAGVARIITPVDAPLTSAHYRLMAVLTAALVIDVMKPASLGFVVPGMTAEYALRPTQVAWLPFAALCGTVLGSIVWGVLADVFGRRSTILLSSVMFVGTSICGAMPSFGWNVAMCFLMGAAAGGMLPVTYALLAETMPSRHRGWVLVLVGGLGSLGGYLAASSLSAWLEPLLSWRILWFLNLPTGLLLIILSVVIPESPAFLQGVGRHEEARRTLRKFGCDVEPAADQPVPPVQAEPAHLVGTTIALSVCGMTWGLVNFGVLLWMPLHLVSQGRSMTLASALLASSALLAAPTVFVAATLYAQWNSKASLLATLGVTALGLGMLVFEGYLDVVIGVSITLIIIGSNGVIAMLLPYAAEYYPPATRGRGVGWVSACTKLGGPLAQGLALVGAAPTLRGAAITTVVTAVLSMLLVAAFCMNTRAHAAVRSPSRGSRRSSSR
jgi:putative MFS transporter